MEDFMNRKTEIKGIIGIRNFWTTDVVSCNNESRKAAKIRKRYNQVLQMSQDTKLESDKNTIKRHKQSQKVSHSSRWPKCNNEQTQKHDKHKT